MRALAFAFLALALAAPALASEERPTLADLEDELVCPTCATTLDQSSAPVADRMRRVIRARIAAGDSKSEIKAELVRTFGPGVVQPAPPREGFGWLAWLLPALGAAAAAVVLGAAAWRWSRVRRDAPAPTASSANGARPIEPELERRLDEELARFET
jgi:cytochrome c-type biogenesis protein CcmH